MSFAELDPVLRQMAPAPFPWGFAGGWAIDLFLDRKRRAHGDLDIALLRQDQARLFQHLSGWRWQAISAGRASDWDGAWIDPPTHELWAHGPDGEQLEFLLNETDGPLWRFRRNPQVEMPTARLFIRIAGYPALAPEIALLYKAKLMQPKDMSDFDDTARHLSATARTWLRDALALAHPGHLWIRSLG